MIVEHLTVGPLGCTCTILGDEASGAAIVIDGGDDVELIAERLAAHDLKPAVLVHTHAHIDHIGALGELRARCGGAGLLHHADLPLYQTLALQAQFLGLPIAPPVVAIDGDLRDGETLRAGALRLDVLHTPGHTPGSTSFALATGEETLLFTGDTLFRQSVGRIDLGGTTMDELVGSIRMKLFAYADDTVVIPGHGPATTIGHERRTNPYAATG
jgi:glyoxylase-like metal-dependent hydrolase (beta-lactamase superfamily II)